MKIAIITPTFERPEGLLTLHRSIRAQEGDVCVRHYIVDDGSTCDYGPTLLRMAEQGDAAFLYRKITNAGPCAARNVAMDLAAADGATHVAFVDDDDTLLPGALAAFRHRLEEDPSRLWLRFRGETGRDTRHKWPDEPVVASWFHDVALFGSPYGGDNCSLLDLRFVGGTRFSRRGRTHREWTFFLRMCRKSDVVTVCPETVVRLHYRTDGLTLSRPSLAAQTLRGIGFAQKAAHYFLHDPRSLGPMLAAARHSLATKLARSTQTAASRSGK